MKIENWSVLIYYLELAPKGLAMCMGQCTLLETVLILGGVTCSGCRDRVELDWKIYKIYGNQDSQSASIIACKIFTNNVIFSGCPTYLTYLHQTGTYVSHLTTFCSTLLVISWSQPSVYLLNVTSLVMPCLSQPSTIFFSTSIAVIAWCLGTRHTWAGMLK